MKIVSISVTDAARNFSDCINRVRYQQTTFILHKNGTPVARIVPETPEPALAQEEAAADGVSARPRSNSPEPSQPNPHALNEEPDIFLG